MAGVERQIQNLAKNRKPAHGAGRKNDWQLHIEGIMGEMALAKYFGLYWSGVGRLRDFDVGNVDVRTRPHERSRLILHKEDPDDRCFFLVLGVNGCYRIRGWIQARDGKREEWWDDPVGGRPCYWIPQEELHPVPPPDHFMRKKTRTRS